MRYFLITYQIPLMFIAGFIGFCILIWAYWSIAAWISTRLGPRCKARSALSTVAVFAAAISLFLMLHYVPDYFNDGRITKIYILRKAAARRLVVWFTREDNPAGMAGVYSQRIKSFDLDTGRLQGRLTLARRHTFNDYRIFGPCGPFAWGCSARHGIAYLNLFETKVIADEQGILKRNPVLGDRVRLVSGPYDRQFDPVTCGICVFTRESGCRIKVPCWVSMPCCCPM